MTIYQITLKLNFLKAILSNLNYTATINLKGAELVSFKNNTTNKEYIWNGNSEFWAKQSPVLFPIVGTLKDNSYFYKDKKYELSRHGFARDKQFKIINQQENEVTFSLHYDEDTLKIYPFKFELQLKYTLLNNKLFFNYKVINLDEISIPFSLGAHPAFALNNDFENYSLAFEKQETLDCFTLENDLLSDKNYTIELVNKKLSLNYVTFKNDALIFKSAQSKTISILENEKEILKISFQDFKNLGIWTKQNAPFICIEPWFGYSDTVNSKGDLFEKEGIQILPKNSFFNCELSVEIL